MKTFVLASAATLMTSQLMAACDDLIISEYIEGSSFNKAIELYNPTAEAIDLSAYSLELFSNGNSVANASVTLEGTLAPEDVFVVSRSNAAAEILAVTDLESGSVINFNGDDAIVLKKGDAVVDAFGQVGVDPGSQWFGNGVGAKDSTLVRKNTILCGDEDALDPFDPSLEWNPFPKDTFEFLGAHIQAVTGGGDNNETNGEGEENNETALLTLIHDIQGDGDASPLVGETVSIEGIVVGDYQEGGLRGFFVQEEDADVDANPLTSEGIFVFCSACTTAVSEGDLVQVEGRVTEFSNLTELTSPVVNVVSSDNVLPTAVTVSLPVADVNNFESVEGMLISLDGGETPLIVNENFNLGRFGTFTVGAERLFQFTERNAPSVEGFAAHLEQATRDRLFIDDGLSTQNPDFVRYPEGGLSADNTLRSGYATAAIVGVMDERFGDYRLQPTEGTILELDTLTNPREAAPQKPDANKKFKRFCRRDMRVVSFNVLNYFNTFDNCTGGVNGASIGCRGADNAEEFERQRVKIINAMLELDADVYGLIEIENDGYGPDSALADLVNGLNEAKGADLYRFVDVDGKLGEENALGTDAIKVAFVYNRKTVKPKRLPRAVELDNVDKNRPALIQVFKRKHTGRKVMLSVNHFKSKGSSCNGIFIDGVEDVDQNDGQGNCNLTRNAAAEVLTDFIANDRFLRKQPGLLLGDFNAYSKEDPIRTMEAAGFSNLLPEDEYSFIFFGEAGKLDHALANAKLAKKVKQATLWHINTDEPRVLDYNLEFKSAEQQTTFFNPDVFRASDHDPVVIDLRF